MINLIEVSRIVLGYFSEKKGRVFLTLAGIIIGIFTFSFFIFMAQGLSNAITEQFESLGVNVLTVNPAGAQAGPSGGEGLTDTDIARIEQVVTGVNYIASSISTSANFELGNEEENFFALGYSEENLRDVFRDLGVEAEQGRLLEQRDRGAILVGAGVANQGYQDQEIQLGNVMRVDDRSFRVIGIMEEQGDFFVDNSIFMPIRDVELISGQSTYGEIRVSFREGTDLEEMQERIENQLNPNPDEPEVDVISPQQVIDQLNEIVGVLTMVIAFVSSIALLVGGVNVMNTIHASVIERSKEISVMKAIGATNLDIKKIFFVESALYGLVGSTVGFLLSFGVAKLISVFIDVFTSFSVPVYFDYSLFIGVVLFTTVLTVIFGLYPASQSAKVKPIDNLNEE